MMNMYTLSKEKVILYVVWTFWWLKVCVEMEMVVMSLSWNFFGGELSTTDLGFQAPSINIPLQHQPPSVLTQSPINTMVENATPICEICTQVPSKYRCPHCTTR